MKMDEDCDATQPIFEDDHEHVPQAKRITLVRKSVAVEQDVAQEESPTKFEHDKTDIANTSTTAESEALVTSEESISCLIEPSQQLLELDEGIKARELSVSTKGVHRRRTIGKLRTESSDGTNEDSSDNENCNTDQQSNNTSSVISTPTTTSPKLFHKIEQSQNSNKTDIVDSTSTSSTLPSYQRSKLSLNCVNPTIALPQSSTANSSSLNEHLRQLKTPWQGDDILKSVLSNRRKAGDQLRSAVEDVLARGQKNVNGRVNFSLTSQDTTSSTVQDTDQKDLKSHSIGASTSTLGSPASSLQQNLSYASNSIKRGLPLSPSWSSKRPCIAHVEERVVGELTSRQDAANALFSVNNRFTLHEVVIVPRRNNQFYYGKIFDPGESKSPVTVLIGRGSTGCPLRKQLPPLFVGKIVQSNELVERSESNFRTIRELCQWIEENASGFPALRTTASFLITHHSQLLFDMTRSSDKISAIGPPKEQPTLASSNRTYNCLLNRFHEAAKRLNEAALAFAFDLASATAEFV